MFSGEEAILSYRKFVFIHGSPEICSFRIQNFVALFQPNSQFVLHVQVHVCLFFSPLC